MSVSTGATAQTELIVVVGESTNVDQMSAREVRKLFMGKSRNLPDGSRAVLARHEPVVTSFNRRALQRSDAQVTRAWPRLTFSGRVRRPRTLASTADVVHFVTDTPGAIAFLVVGDSMPQGVRAVFVVPGGE